MFAVLREGSGLVLLSPVVTWFPAFQLTVLDSMRCVNLAQIQDAKRKATYLDKKFPLIYH